MLATIDAGSYQISLGKAADLLEKELKANAYSKVFLLTDTKVQDFAYPKIEAVFESRPLDSIIAVSAGEANKNLSSLADILQTLQAGKADRQSLLINLGGGMVSDIGGFAASIYGRGMAFINIPTSLLAMVDASIGGKTGINLGAQKNRVGSFSFPKAVLIDPAFLDTLPEAECLSGLAEVVKHALILDADLFRWMRFFGSKKLFDRTDFLDLIHTALKLKNGIVRADPTEKGLRKILNFGHTFGHAFEALSLTQGKTHLLHGHAVAMGMICESFLSRQKTGLSEKELTEITNYLKLDYATQPIELSDFEVLIELMQQDKKNENGKINCTLLSQIGKARHDQICTVKEVTDALNYYNLSIKELVS